MIGRESDRAVSVQIGAVLLLAILVSTIALWQATVIPDENHEIEFEHFKDVQEQLLDLRNGILSSGGESSHSVSLEVQYPGRTMFINPPAPQSELRTIGGEDTAFSISIENAIARDEDTADFWNGSEQSYATRTIEYVPGYNEYDTAPTVMFEHSALVSLHDDTTAIPQTGQSIIDGASISIVSLDGSIDDRGDSSTIDLRDVSTSDTSVDVHEASDPIELTFPSTLPVETWESIFESDRQMHDQNGHITDVSETGEITVDDRTFTLITVTLEPDVTYTLDVSRIGVGPDVTHSTPAYVVGTDGGGTISIDEEHDIGIEVRDQYDNPIADAEVNAEIISGEGSLDRTTATSTSDGTVTFSFSADGETTATVEASIGDGSSDSSTVAFEIDVTDSTSAPSNDSAYDVRWADEQSDSTLQDCDEDDVSCSGEDFYVTMNADSITLTAETVPDSISEATVDFAISDDGTETTILDQDDTFEDGTAEVTLDGFDQTGVLTVYVSSGASSAETTIKVDDEGTTASFDFEPSEPTPGETVTFDASDSSGDVVEYEWDFDDGNTETTTDPIIEHTFTESGEYEVELTVRDENDETDTTTMSVSVEADASFTYTEEPTSGGPGHSEVSFTVEHSGSPIDVEGIEVRTDDAQSFESISIEADGQSVQRTGSFATGEEHGHEAISVVSEDILSYDLGGFDGNMNNAELTIVIYDADGTAYELPTVST